MPRFKKKKERRHIGFVVSKEMYQALIAKLQTSEEENLSQIARRLLGEALKTN